MRACRVPAFPKTYDQRKTDRHNKVEESDDIVRFKEVERAGRIESAQLCDVLNAQN